MYVNEFMHNAVIVIVDNFVCYTIKFGVLFYKKIFLVSLCIYSVVLM